MRCWHQPDQRPTDRWNKFIRFIKKRHFKHFVKSYLHKVVYFFLTHFISYPKQRPTCFFFAYDSHSVWYQQLFLKAIHRKLNRLNISDRMTTAQMSLIFELLFISFLWICISIQITSCCSQCGRCVNVSFFHFFCSNERGKLKKLKVVWRF